MTADILSQCSQGDRVFGHSKCFYYNIVNGVFVAVRKHRGMIHPMFLYNRQWQ